MKPKSTYGDKLKDPRWQKKRLKTFERDNWACSFCGDKDSTLHVHHKKYNGDPWQADLSDLTTICEDCHSIVHDINIPSGNIVVLKKHKKGAVLGLVAKGNDGITIYAYDYGVAQWSVIPMSGEFLQLFIHFISDLKT